MKKWSGIFLAVEAALYLCILTCGGTVLVLTSFGAILLCCGFALAFGERENRFLRLGLLCTVGADFCLVVCNPIRQLEGMIFFLAAQSLYALWLGGTARRWTIRGIVSGLSLLVTVSVLREKTDALALISVCYYGNLILNLLFSAWDRKWLFAVAFGLFLLCDTVVGLQVAAGGYLPIGEGTALHRLLFSGFNLAWFFYLPSQTLLALGAAYGKR